jgi:hypothetical protein
MAQIITVRLRSSLGRLSPVKRPTLRAMWYLKLAKLHTALAQVAATARSHRDGREWFDVAGTKFSG